ncbi:MAG TPA: hypothetical protein VM925_28835, partial [Labilithrix sp.]|nr:hypothetical protein [Labilithrix sp.]
MRRRPDVKLYLTPGVVSPGQRVRAEVVLTSASDTPVEYVSFRLWTTATGSAGGRTLFSQESRVGAFRMLPGEHRIGADFDVPASCPPSYIGRFASIDTALTVHVAIPWWLDRKQSFRVPVTLAPVPPLDPVPKVFVSRHDGPRGNAPYVELALDATQIALGDLVSGSISLQNLGGAHVRAVDLSFVVTETIGVATTTTTTSEVRRFTTRVFEGKPEDGGPIPFRVVMPVNATPSLDVGGIRIDTLVEVRAHVARGSDIALTARVLVTARSTEPRVESDWIAPVGHERKMLVWHKVAMRTGLVTDPEVTRMIGRRGVVTIAIETERRDGDYWLVANLGWPSLGLDLQLNDRRWTDALAGNVLKSGDGEMDGRFRAHAREHLQAKAIVNPAVLGALTCFEEVKIEDAGGHVAVRGISHGSERLDAFVRNVLSFAKIFDEVAERV